jgi:hypothetical protein
MLGEVASGRATRPFNPTVDSPTQATAFLTTTVRIVDSEWPCPSVSRTTASLPCRDGTRLVRLRRMTS